MEKEHHGADSAGPPEARAVPMPGGRLVTTVVAAERTGWAYSLFEVEVGPGGGEGPHIQHREDECLYVLEGSFGLVVEGVPTQAGPGAHLYVPKGTLHAYENRGEGAGRMLVVHTPGGPQESFVAAAGGPATGPTPEAFGLLAAEHGIEICKPTANTERSF